MRVLFLNGSGRRDGATARALQWMQKVLASEEQADTIHLADLFIENCAGCAVCETGHVCPCKDDLEQLMQRIAASDVLVIGAPSYWGGIPGRMKNMIDRCNPWGDTVKEHKTLPGAGEKKAYTIALRTGKSLRECLRIHDDLAHWLGHLGIGVHGTLSLPATPDRVSVDAQKEQIEQTACQWFAHKEKAEKSLPAGIVIRLATPQDAAALVAYSNGVGGESDNLTFGKDEFRFNVEQEEAYLREVAAQPTSGFFVAEHRKEADAAGEIVAVGSFAGASKKRLAHAAELGMTVRKSHWGQGVGEALLRGLIANAKQKGLSILDLQVRTDNAAAIRLYQRCGFRITGLLPRFLRVEGKDYDAYYMVLELDKL